MKNFKNLFFAIVLGSALSACGNSVQKYDQLSTQSSGLGTQSSSSTSFADQNCSANPNIIGTDDTINTQYRACHYGSTTGSVAMYPADQTARAVCVFPLRVTSNGQPSAIVQNMNNPIETRFVYQCVNVQGSGSVVAFAGLTYNGMYVVDQDNARALAYCMAYGDVATCTNSANITISYGQFK